MEEEATGPGRSRTRNSSPATASASSSTTPRPRRERRQPGRIRLGLAEGPRRRARAPARASGRRSRARGAEVLIQVAPEDRRLKALVADGATGGSFADQRNLGEDAERPPFYLTMYTSARVLSGESPGGPLKELVARIAPTRCC